MMLSCFVGLLIQPKRTVTSFSNYKRRLYDRKYSLSHKANNQQIELYEHLFSRS